VSGNSHFKSDFIYIAGKLEKMHFVKEEPSWSTKDGNGIG
jgi:hypothetical protein